MAQWLNSSLSLPHLLIPLQCSSLSNGPVNVTNDELDCPWGLFLLGTPLQVRPDPHCQKNFDGFTSGLHGTELRHSRNGAILNPTTMTTRMKQGRPKPAINHTNLLRDPRALSQFSTKDDLVLAQGWKREMYTSSPFQRGT
ncbi:hypothetical protein B9Z19DRAFT_1134262 [Tuber borchii]|uniref:Uncharacterized protein n=1 Tax=Tuber borchii TaxID=42251 RepID=A0A2T6ZED9_TUBBO|nr:hypothetical protein B9Z19DRAFT_1134262 [Tuber borchii]